MSPECSSDAVLVAFQLADEFSAAGSQAGHDGVDVLDDECDMADARVFAGAFRLPPCVDGEWNFTSSSRPCAEPDSAAAAAARRRLW